MQKIKEGFIKNIVSVLLAVTLAFPITFFAGCGEKISDYTVEEHIAKVSKKVEARYFADDGKYEYTDYEVYPLYNENDELEYFLVEFQPFGYVYIWIWEPSFLPGDLAYYRAVGPESEVWQRYTVAENAGDDISDEEIIWEVDKNGEYIYYQDSHFKVAGIENEKRYLLRAEADKIPAVKRNGGYLNLFTMQIMEDYNPTISKNFPSNVETINFVPKVRYCL